MPETTELSNEEIAKVVRHRIETERASDPYFKDIPFEVDETRIARYHDYISVPIRPTVKPRFAQYVDSFLAHVNVEVMDETGVSILFSPEVTVDEEG